MSEPVKPVTACMLVIGNEILSGRTQDLNVAYIAKGLAEIGVRLSEVRIIPDVPETIVETLNHVRVRFDHVLTTGGIGPTHDDITAECVARAFGVPLTIHPEAYRRLDESYRARDLSLNEARLRMAHTPEGAALIDNPVSVAPGFQIENVYVMAGVPKIAQAMFDGLKPRLRGGPVVLSRTIACRLAEGQIAAGLGAIQDANPAVEIGSYPRWTTEGASVSLVIRGTDTDAIGLAGDQVAELIRSLGGVPEDIETA